MFSVYGNFVIRNGGFACWDEGCYIGEVGKEVIAQMPKCN